MRTRRAPLLLALVAFLLLVTVGAACSDDDQKEDGSTPSAGQATTTASAVPDASVSDPTAIPAGATPADTLEAAVQTLLTAEQVGDHGTSYALLDAAARADFPSQGDWERRRSQFPAMVSFRVERADDSGVVVLVQHQPGLDPFIGLSETERQTWTGVHTSRGWLVDSEPDRVFVLPPDDAAVPAAKTWLQAVQRCDQATAAAAQAVADLYGDVTKAAGLCGAPGEIATGAVGALESGPASSDIVAQYTTDALTWTRVVRVTAPVQFGVVMAPIGETWKVLGITA